MKEKAFKVMWGFDNTIGFKVICMTLEIINSPNLLYFQTEVFSPIGANNPLTISETLRVWDVGWVFANATRH